MAQSPNPCSAWIVEADLCCDLTGISAAIKTRSISAATDLLNMATGGIFPGSCERTVQPTAQYSRESDWRWWEDNWTTWDSGTWVRNSRVLFDGYCSCNRSTRLGCTRLAEIKLSSTFPIREVTEVKIDGSILDSSLYEIRDHRWLRRLPDAAGDNPGWPCCARQDLPDTDDDTFYVTFTVGTPPPSSGVIAAASLACELIKLCNGDATCLLPKRAVSASRQGVSIQLGALTDLFDRKATGIYEVDLFLAMYAPAKGRGYGGILIPGKGPLYSQITN